MTTPGPFAILYLEQSDLRYIGPWRPNTAYPAGYPVIAPSGKVMLANGAITTGASYDAAQFTDAAGSSSSVLLSQVGQADGVASLDSAGRLPRAQRALRSISVKTGAYSLTSTDDIVVAGGTTAYAVTLPSAATNAGREFTVKRTSTGLITVASAAGTIDGTTTRTLNAVNTSETYVSDGTNWMVV